MLTEVGRRCPEVLPLARQAYVTPSPLHFDGTVIESQTGVQQGDPLGPLCCSLALDPVIRAVKSEFNVWYLDDGTIGESVLDVVVDLVALEGKLLSLGLHLNPGKCEVVYLGSWLSPEHRRAIAVVSAVILGMVETVRIFPPNSKLIPI